MILVGSISPFSMRFSSGCMYRCTWHWPVRSVIDRFVHDPDGNLSRKPP
jgi:hypothetical protein